MTSLCGPCTRSNARGRHRAHRCEGDPPGFAAGAPCSCPCPKSWEGARLTTPTLTLLEETP